MLVGTFENGQVSDIGSCPFKKKNSGQNVAVSLITEEAYTNKSTKVKVCRGAFKTYIKNHEIKPATKDEIVKNRNAYFATLAKPFKFGSFTLNAANELELENHVYVYKTITGVEELKQEKVSGKLASLGKKLLEKVYNKKAKEIYDFVVLSQMSKEGVPTQNLGMRYSEDATIFLSLITGNVYNKAGDTPINRGYN